MANLKKNELQEKYARKNKERRKKGKQTTSKDLPPGVYRNTGSAIEKRRKMLRNI